MLINIGCHLKTGQPVMLDTLRAINSNVQISGITGMGKTHRIRSMAESLVQSASSLRKPIRVHVFDPHGDIDLPWCSEVKFSESTSFGYNPLEINPDPDDSTLAQYSIATTVQMPSCSIQ